MGKCHTSRIMFKGIFFVFFLFSHVHETESKLSPLVGMWSLTPRECEKLRNQNERIIASTFHKLKLLAKLSLIEQGLDSFGRTIPPGIYLVLWFGMCAALIHTYFFSFLLKESANHSSVSVYAAKLHLLSRRTISNLEPNKANSTWDEGGLKLMTLDCFYVWIKWTREGKISKKMTKCYGTESIKLL